MRGRLAPHALAIRTMSAGALLWAAALPTAAASAASTNTLAVAVATVVYGVGHVICHQLPERSFMWGGMAWPVCARCVGIYMGAAIGVVWAVIAGRESILPTSTVRSRLAASVAPALVSILYEWSTGRIPSNAWRAWTGVPMGLVLMILLTQFIRSDQSGSRIVARS